MKAVKFGLGFTAFLFSIIEESKQSLIKEERLILPIRKKIWLGFGEIKMTDTYAQKTIALIGRVKLWMVNILS